MLIDYFNGCARAHILGIAAQIQIMGEPSLVLIGLWFDISIFGRLQKSIRLRLGRRKSLKTTKICSFLFRLYFVIVEDWSCISLFINMNIYGIDCQKNSWDVAAVGNLDSSNS
jgi:hypothetical protein